MLFAALVVVSRAQVGFETSSGNPGVSIAGLEQMQTVVRRHNDFKGLDRDGDQFLQGREIVPLFKLLYMPERVDRLKKFFNDIDTNSDNKISFKGWSSQESPLTLTLYMSQSTPPIWTRPTRPLKLA